MDILKEATARPWEYGKYSKPPDAAETIGYWIDSPAGDIADVVDGTTGEANAALIVLAVNAHAGLVEALKAAVERMEAVSDRIVVEKRHKGISQATHVRHMAGHLAQHAKIARAALAAAGK